MSDIKVIAGLEPWEVIKRAGDGEQFAYRDYDDFDGNWKTPSGSTHLRWNMHKYEFAIIDTTTTSIDWDKVDWDFFNQYGGIPVLTPDIREIRRTSINQDLWNELRESPFYYWPGGAQPLPDNVEVEVIFRDDQQSIRRAGASEWARVFAHDERLADIIAFKLTGRVL